MSSTESPRSLRPTARPRRGRWGQQFVSAMRRLWVTHDPLRFVGDGAETLDVHDHQAYVTALCADEIGSAADAEKVIATILRHEFPASARPSGPTPSSRRGSSASPRTSPPSSRAARPRDHAQPTPPARRTPRRARS